MRVNILEHHEDYNYNNYFKILRARLQYERFDGTLSPEVERLAFERGDAVGVLLYDAAQESVFLIKQFRYPAYLRDGLGWTLELVAGTIDKGRDALTVAHSELIEEIGYQIDHLDFVCQFYLSPGGTTERMSLYIGQVHQARQVNAGGGLVSEHEDIQLVQLPLKQAIQMIHTGEICDAKTIIALQHQALLTFPDKNI